MRVLCFKKGLPLIIKGVTPRWLEVLILVVSLIGTVLFAIVMIPFTTR